MTSLYHALKSAARVVRALVWLLVSAMNARLDGVDSRCVQDGLLRTAAQVLENQLPARALVGADDEREACVPGVGELELFAYRLRSQGVLHPEAGIAQLVSEGKYMGQVVLGDESQENVNARDVGRH